LNLPYGTPVKTGIDVAAVDFVALLKELLVKSFNGYACITINGGNGVEEGVVLFDNGKVVASFYEYFKHVKTVQGDHAFVRVMNASSAKDGVIELFQLSNEQVQLILAFNEQAISIPTEKDYKNFKTASFSRTLEEQIRPPVENPSEAEVLKKYKITDAVEQAEAPATPVSPPVSEDELKDLLGQA